MIRGVDWAFYPEPSGPGTIYVRRNNRTANRSSCLQTFRFKSFERCHIHVDLQWEGRRDHGLKLEHEIDRKLLNQVVWLVAEVCAIPFKSAGQTTWKRPDVARGLEADESYFFHADKLDAVAAGKARRSLDIADYPNPDLGIEVDMSPRRSTGQRSMPRSKSPRSGVSTGSTSRSSSSGWRTTAPTAPWTAARSCRCTARRFVAGSSKKTPTTNPSGASSPRLGPRRGGAAVARLIPARIGEVDRRILARSSLKLDQTPGVAQLRKTDRGG